MKKLTIEQIIEILEKEVKDIVYLENWNKDKEIEGIGKIIRVDGRNEGEGGVKELWMVNYFPDHDIYLKTQGSYYSYDGNEWDEGWGEQVYPHQIEITVYNNTK